MTQDAARPRLTYLLTSFNSGGAEWGLVNLLRLGAFEGFEVEVAALVRGAGAQVGALQALGVRPVILNDVARLTPWALLVAAGRLRRHLRRVRPDVLLLSLPHANILGRLLRPSRPAPLVVSFEHNSRLAKRIYELAYRTTSGRVDWALADCQATAEAALARNYRRRPARVDVLPLAAFPPDRLTAPRPACSSADGVQLVTAGRLSRTKNQARMIALLEGLRQRGLDARLTLYGEGPLRGALEAEAAQRGLQAHVRLAGQTPQWWREPADLFLLTSRHEGLCIAALEAMAAGLPVAAPPVGGLCDYGEAAQMLTLSDDDAADADRLASRLADPAALHAMAQAGRAMAAQRFSTDAVVAAYAAFAARLREAAADRGL